MPPGSALTELRAMGGLYEARARVHRPESVEALAALFGEARARGVRLTLVGGRRSFGEHFLPPAGAEAVDTTGIGGVARALEPDAEGLWVSAPGGTSFERLAQRFPGYLPEHPPTGDRITLAGALAACTHDAVGYFADAVRAFTVMTPDGRVHHCRAGASGLAGALFRDVPGSFGALGVILALELRLRLADAAQRAEITVLEKRPHAERAQVVDRLEALYQAGEYPLGRGVFFFGRRGPVVLLGDRQVLPRPLEKLRPPPLADGALARSVYLQGIANRIPGVVRHLVPPTFVPGRRFHAALYDFKFFQRSYDRAYEILSGGGVLPRVLRGVGVDPRLTVCHTTFAIPAARRHAFLALYFETLDAFPELGARAENQDDIRLSPCRWPMHGSAGMAEGAHLFSPSFSVRRGTALEARARMFLAEVGRSAFEKLGVKVILLKQVHLEPSVLRRMHAPFLERLRGARDRADPERRLTSRLLESLEATDRG